MEKIDGPFNPELMDILDPFIEWFFSQDRTKIKLKGKKDKKDFHTSEDYLKTINKEKHIGFPEVTHGIDLGMNIEATPNHYRDKILKLDNDLNNFFVSKFCAVKMYYPVGGYMGWHHNANCPGYNILLSYNRSGNGFFRYLDPKTKEIVTMEDEPGWTVKVGYYGSFKEPDKIYWHCARAYDERITLGFVIPDEEFWKMMIDDLKDVQ